MKDIKEKKSNMFSNLFEKAVHFKAEDISDWIIPSIYYLKDLTDKQLQLISLLEIEILNDGEVLFIQLNSKDHKVIIKTLTEMGKIIDYRKKLELIPLWIRKIFKAD